MQTSNPALVRWVVPRWRSASAARRTRTASTTSCRNVATVVGVATSRRERVAVWVDPFADVAPHRIAVRRRVAAQRSKR